MIGIIGAMEEEVALLSQALTKTVIHSIGPFRFMQGLLGNQEVVLLQCGIGKVQAAVGCALLIDHFKPRLIINSGSAGGISSDLAVGDLVISEGALYHDVDVTAFGYEAGQIPGQPPIFSADRKSEEIAEKAFENLKKEGTLPPAVRCTRGIIGSGDSFMHDPERITALKKRFPRVCAVEMEGAAIAHTCALFGVPFVILRSISDVAGKESPYSFEEFLHLASHHSSVLVQKMISLLGGSL